MDKEEVAQAFEDLIDAVLTPQEIAAIYRRHGCRECGRLNKQRERGLK